jgi:hypothetical protein
MINNEIKELIDYTIDINSDHLMTLKHFKKLMTVLLLMIMRPPIIACVASLVSSIVISSMQFPISYRLVIGATLPAFSS